jgi:hypothetical protein
VDPKVAGVKDVFSRYALRSYFVLGVAIGVTVGLIASDWGSFLGVAVPVILGAALCSIILPLCAWAMAHRAKH